MAKQPFIFKLGSKEYHTYETSVLALKGYYDILYISLSSYAARLCGNEDDAKDHVHESFKIVIEKIYSSYKTGTILNIEHPKSYLYTIMKNLFLSSNKNQFIRIEKEHVLMDSAELLLNIERRQSQEILSQCISMLPAKQRFIVEMHWDGCGYRDIALKMTPPSNEVAIRKAASRAKASLKECVAQKV